MIEVDIQHASEHPSLPAEGRFQRWTEAALAGRHETAEVLIRLVDEGESARLNADYRGKNDPTNVLSFPFEVPPGVPNTHLGDLVICAPVVAREAGEQAKSVEAHWAHLTVHGVLHLLGFDHIEDTDAERMEAEEIRILQSLGFPNPYQEQ
ncbi:MAG TPA: rRNA maturation RNase YbeY [Methylococcaceae bacterium]|nr:rRNA maturation RNase YbeY [Methylococcaceae bacterium]